MNQPPPDIDGQIALPLTFASANTAEPESLTIAGTELAVFTRAAPNKDGASEDAVMILQHSPGTLVIAIADGAGGYAGGGTASATAVDALRRASAEGSELPARAAILNGFESAHQAIKDNAGGAATTLAVIELSGSQLRTYNAGDSGIVVTGQRGRIKLQSVSHSPTGYAVEAGLLDPGEALHHEERHMVSNLLGLEPMSVEIGSPLTLAANDPAVIASDGLFDNVYVDEIVEIVRKGKLSVACARLVSMSLERMQDPPHGAPSKPDDLSIVLVRRARRTATS